MAEPVPVFTGTVSTPIRSYTQCAAAGRLQSLNAVYSNVLGRTVPAAVAPAIVTASGPTILVLIYWPRYSARSPVGSRIATGGSMTV